MVTNPDTQAEKALERRRAFLTPFTPTEAVRIIHSEGDGFPGVTVDRLGRGFLVETHRRDADPSPLIHWLERRFGPGAPVFLKERWSSSWRGRAGWQVAGHLCHPELVITENGVSFWIRLTAEEHIGLFLDGRPARQRVREIAGDRRVLNLFSYTGGFGVAAALGGARSTTNIDNKRSALKIAEKNYRLNRLPYDTRTFLRDDVFRHLGRRVKGRGQFDLIIVDPPTVSIGAGKQRFSVKRNYVRLAAKCCTLLSEKGLLLAGINAGGVPAESFEKTLCDGAAIAGKNIDIIEKIAPGTDFPPSEDRPVGQFVLSSISGNQR